MSPVVQSKRYFKFANAPAVEEEVGVLQEGSHEVSPPGDMFAGDVVLFEEGPCKRQL